MAKLNLPDLEADIVRRAEHAVPLGNGPSVRLHVSKVGGGTVGKAYDGNWEWAVLLHAVAGWEVIAYGTDVTTPTPKTHDQVAEMIAEQHRGEDGDGVDRLPRDRYTQLRPGADISHIRRDDPATTYCGKPGGPDAVFDTKEKGHATQHCIDCDARYRAEHWGRTPVTY